MTNSSKAKGDAAERALVQWLRENGYPDAERIRAGWAEDRGDIEGVPGLVIEVKSAKTMRLGDWLEELDVEKANARCDDGVLIVKRIGKSDPGEWYAIRRVRDEFKEDA